MTMNATASTNDGFIRLSDVALTRKEFTQLLMLHRFAIDEVTTKVNILRDEYTQIHDYNPIEHIESRLKSPEGIVEKAQRRGCRLDLGSIRRDIHDIAGVRIVCSFESDVYNVFDILRRQTDITVIEVEDYITHPKPNGYRSLHAIVQIPVFLSTGAELVDVELQLRTVAMDFWASLEHKIYYKYERQVPAALLDELHEAATTATQLDQRMQRLHREITGSDHADDAIALS